MTEFESITFFIDRCLGNKLIVETLRGAGLTVEIHDDHFGKNGSPANVVKMGKMER